jgi:hypothetical protein
LINAENVSKDYFDHVRQGLIDFTKVLVNAVALDNATLAAIDAALGAAWTRNLLP